jgi:ribosomal protein L11 methylase PrmA
MAPVIALESLKEHKGRPLRVLDPMSGSGTSLVVARALGHTAIGLDTDPLAELIAKAWCTDVDEERVLAKADDVLGRSLSRLKELSVGN